MLILRCAGAEQEAASTGPTVALVRGVLVREGRFGGCELP